jgi:opacity protein-like surface antigen
VSAVLAGTIGVTSAAAQARRSESREPVPAPGMVAIGGSFGAAPPSEASFTNGPTLAGNIEGYLTRRVSLRGQVSGAWWDITGRGFTGNVQPVAFDANVVYNFEGGRIHPFVTGGVGLYHYRFQENPVTGSTNKAGLDVGGGVEYFVHRHATATAEVLFHNTQTPVTSPLTTFNDSSYWTFTVGMKRYF